MHEKLKWHVANQLCSGTQTQTHTATVEIELIPFDVPNCSSPGEIWKQDEHDATPNIFLRWSRLKYSILGVREDGDLSLVLVLGSRKKATNFPVFPYCTLYNTMVTKGIECTATIHSNGLLSCYYASNFVVGKFRWSCIQDALFHSSIQCFQFWGCLQMWQNECIL